jgi:hypothetical protein
MHEGNAKSAAGIAAMGLAALGVVFDDIGTSPLYTLKTVLDVSRGETTILSLSALRPRCSPCWCCNSEVLQFQKVNKRAGTNMERKFGVIRKSAS